MLERICYQILRAHRSQKGAFAYGELLDVTTFGDLFSGVLTVSACENPRGALNS